MTALPSPSRASMRGFFGRDLVYVALWGSQVGLAVLLTPVTTRLLGPSHYGLAATCITIMQLLVAVGGFSLGLAIQRAYAASGDVDARKLLTLALAIAFAVFVVVDLTGPIWARAIGSGSYHGAVRYAVMWATCTAGTSAVLAVLRSRDRLVPFALVNLTQTVLAEAVSLALILLVRRTATEYILGEFIAQAVTVVLALALVRPAPVSVRDRGLMWSALRFATPLVPVAVAEFVLATSDRLIVQADLGSAAVARYAVASNVGSIPILLLGMLATSWMPRVFALSDTGALPKAIAHSRDGLYALLIPAAIGLAVISPLVLRIWAPPSYRPDGLLFVVAIIIATAFPFAAATSHSRVLMSAGRTRAAAGGAVGAAAVNLGLNFVLVPIWGIVGSAVATLVANIVMALLLAAAARTVFAVPPPPARLLVAIGLSIGVVFGAAFLPVTTPALVMRLLLGVISGSFLLALALGLAGRTGHAALRPMSAWLGDRVGLAMQ
ncbi:MAG: oligosaccharide flippase family protein [Solirubrobacteraceae bacterium]